MKNVSCRGPARFFRLVCAAVAVAFGAAGPAHAQSERSQVLAVCEAPKSAFEAYAPRIFANPNHPDWEMPGRVMLVKSVEGYELFYRDELGVRHALSGEDEALRVIAAGEERVHVLLGSADHFLFEFDGAGSARLLWARPSGHISADCVGELNLGSR